MNLTKKHFIKFVSALVIATLGVGCSLFSALSSEKTITDFAIGKWVGVISGHTIKVTVPYGTDVTKLVATFKTTGVKVKVGTKLQVSGSTRNDFTDPVMYEVTAEDKTSAEYKAVVAIGPNPLVGVWLTSEPQTIDGIDTTLYATLTLSKDGTWTEPGHYSPAVPNNTFLTSTGTWTSTAKTITLTMIRPSQDTMVLSYTVSDDDKTLTLTYGASSLTFSRR